MSDYISRQAAIIQLSHNKSRGDDEWMLAVESDMGVIEALPAADVVPVVHGKWIPHKEKSREYIGTVLVHVSYDYWLCDTCGYRVENGQPMYNFCPNCGAKMDCERKE